jgi:hypothetical protein
MPLLRTSLEAHQALPPPLYPPTPAVIDIIKSASTQTAVSTRPSQAGLLFLSLYKLSGSRETYGSSTIPSQALLPECRGVTSSRPASFLSFLFFLSPCGSCSSTKPNNESSLTPLSLRCTGREEEKPSVFANPKERGQQEKRRGGKQEHDEYAREATVN